MQAGSARRRRLAPRSRSAAFPPARSSRSRLSRSPEAPLLAIEEFVRGLGLDAYLVGGAVRDEVLGLPSKDADFLVAGVDLDELAAALRPHGRVEELKVAGRTVGL